MNLNFLINSLYGGGAEKQMLTLLERLEYANVFTLESEKTPPAKIKNHHSLSTHGHETSNLVKFLSIGRYAGNLSGKLRKDDLLISFMTKSNLVNVKAAQKTNHTSVICERTNPSREFTGLRSILYKPLIKRNYPDARFIVANSEGVKYCLSTNFGLPAQRIKVINNHIDNAWITTKMTEEIGEFGKLFEFPVLINSGRLTEAKAQWRLLSIFSLIKKTNPETKLVILGDGELKEYLISLSKALGLKTFDIASDRFSIAYDVYFFGFQHNPYKFLYRSKIFVFTSLWEGFPNALIEAMSCRLPVVSSNCEYGPLEILSIRPAISEYGDQRPRDSDFGILMPVLKRKKIKRNVEPEPEERQWAEVIRSLLGDYKKLDNYSGLATTRAFDFDISKICPKWKKLAE